MRNLTQIIEQHLKNLIDASEKNVAEIQRNKLAEIFNCAPSQINYVLDTRFTMEKGYLVSSRRGGGGYIIVEKLSFKEGHKLILIQNSVGNAVTQEMAEEILKFMSEEGYITLREKELLNIVLHRDILCLPSVQRDKLRANLLRAVIAKLASM